MNEQQIIEQLNAAVQEERQLRSTLLDGYDAWVTRRRTIRHYAFYACVALLLVLPAKTLTAQQLPANAMNVDHPLSRMEMNTLGDILVEAL